jgi:multiple sugar transport system ATP-binding protein
MKRIEIRNLSKRFLSLRGRIEALKEVNLQIEPGTFFVLLGPSGCGKSTLLNIIAGIERPTSGEVWMDDKLVVSVEKRIYRTPRDRNVAMVFQSYALYPHMNVFENIAFPLKTAKTDKGEIESRVDKVARMLEISQLLRAKPSELSGGQRQRVAIGRAIVRRPNVLLLDEPLSNLDAQLRIHMRGELKQLQKQLGVTTVYVTHDQTEAVSLGDKLAAMKDGRIQQVGTARQMYDDPENVFVAGFIGTPPINLLNAEILNSAKRQLNIEKRLISKKIVAGLRPEHVLVTKETGGGAFQAEINLIASQGVQTLIYLKSGMFEILGIRSGDVRFTEGESVGVDFDESNLFFFDKETGKRIRVEKQD